MNSNNTKKSESASSSSEEDQDDDDEPMDGSKNGKGLEPWEAAELKRLHSIGIPVPGIEIKVDKSVARVWLEDLTVECDNTALRDRVRAIVDRAVEVVAPLWAE